MLSKKKRLAACKLYLILDTQVCDYARLWQVLKQVSGRGVDIVQLRDKVGTARETLEFARKVQRFLSDRIPFIVNDRADIARLAGASGVHVGQGDLPVAEARRIVGRGRIVGTSAQTIAHLQRAVQNGADYVGFGSVFRTLTKPDRQPMNMALLKEAAKIAQAESLPLFAIGGIGRQNLALVTACGAVRVAVCRDILMADDVRSAVGEFERGLVAGIR